MNKFFLRFADAGKYFPLLLILSIILGGFTGYFWAPAAACLKPLGDLFLNLIFTAVVPLVFFSVSAAIARIGGSGQLQKIITAMVVTFLLTSTIAAIFMLVVVNLYSPAQNLLIKLTISSKTTELNFVNQIINTFSVTDFSQLFSHEHMLALIIFSILVGLACAFTGEKSKVFAQFLQSGNEVSMKIIHYIMFYAPIGFFAYFAVLFGDLGTKLLHDYFRATVIYYSAGMLYFMLAYTFYAYCAGGTNSIKIFWQNVLLPMLTALATCSSAASIPANLQAVKKIGVPPNIYETIIPLGSILHKDGTVLGAIVKIAFLFGVFHLNFTDPGVWFTALLIALLVGTVMGAIPSGGMLGEMLILTIYGFPPEALMMIAAISIIIDPLATMLNVTGNTVCSMVIARFVQGRAWLQTKQKIYAQP